MTSASCGGLCSVLSSDFRGQRTEETLTVHGEAGLWLVVFAGELPDVEGLGGRVGQQTEHQDDGVGLRKTVRMDVSVQETKT